MCLCLCDIQFYSSMINFPLAFGSLIKICEQLVTNTDSSRQWKQRQTMDDGHLIFIMNIQIEPERWRCDQTFSNRSRSYSYIPNPNKIIIAKFIYDVWDLINLHVHMLLLFVCRCDAFMCHPYYYDSSSSSNNSTLLHTHCGGNDGHMTEWMENDVRAQ